MLPNETIYATKPKAPRDQCKWSENPAYSRWEISLVLSLSRIPISICLFIFAHFFPHQHYVLMKCMSVLHVYKWQVKTRTRVPLSSLCLTGACSSACWTPWCPVTVSLAAFLWPPVLIRLSVCASVSAATTSLTYYSTFCLLFHFLLPHTEQ